MKEHIIIDTGPLVAFFNGRDMYHEWIKRQWREIKPPLFTCEAVISEAVFLLSKYERAKNGLFELFRRGILTIPFSLFNHIDEVNRLIKKYSNIPMSLADGCLVRMSELYSKSNLLTLDTDFTIYRKNRNQMIPLLHPPG